MNDPKPDNPSFIYLVCLFDSITFPDFGA